MSSDVKLNNLADLILQGAEWPVSSHEGERTITTGPDDFDRSASLYVRRSGNSHTSIDD